MVVLSPLLRCHALDNLPQLMASPIRFMNILMKPSSVWDRSTSVNGEGVVANDDAYAYLIVSEDDGSFRGELSVSGAKK